VIHGLRDPLARDPVEVIGAARERRFAINWDWKPYMSMEPRIIAVRAGLLLQPPRTVVFTLQGGTLHVSGVASESWLRGARTRALLIPGITAFDDAAVSDNDRAAIDRARAALAAATLYFEAASDVISAKEQEKLDALLPTLASIREEIGALPKRYLVEITGRADAPGTVEFNLRLSQDRAEAVRQYLIARGVPTALLVARGIGVGDSPSNSMGHNVLSRHTEADESERRVNFALVPDDAATAP
jgi:OOP family OmpA-OmpF porin